MRMRLMKPKLIVLSGPSRCGKDTLADAILDELAENCLKFDKISLATTLKQECMEECAAKFGISSFTEITAEKNIIRPFLVESSKKKRFESNGSYYFNKAMESVNHSIWKGYRGAVIPDLRYLEYSSDEAVLAKKAGAKIIYLDREDVDFANEEERLNLPRIKNIADMVIKSERTFYPRKKSKDMAKQIIEKLQNDGYLARI